MTVMRTQRNAPAIVMAALAALAMCACKPTEKNYKAAYDAALEKRMEVAAEAAAPDGTLLIDDDGYTRVPAGGRNVLVRTLPLRRVADEKLPSLPLSAEQAGSEMTQDPGSAAQSAEATQTEMRVPVSNLAVASYRMRANALGHAARLRDEGWPAFVLVDADDNFYTIAGGYLSLPDAADAASRYAAGHKDTPYVGLPDEPVILSVPLF